MPIIDTILNDFFWRALVGGLGVALVAGPLGCFVVWRRMAYFGDTLAHSALLGIALSFLLSVPLHIGVVLVSVALAVVLVLLSRTRALATDTILGILAHSALAIGLVTLSFMPEVRIDLTGLLFGDLLAMSREDLLWIYGGAAVILTLLVWLWQGLLMSTIHEELARVEGVPVETLRLVLVLMFSLVIAVAMKIVGVLLITALLIIPAATADYRPADHPGSHSSASGQQSGTDGGSGHGIRFSRRHRRADPVLASGYPGRPFGGGHRLCSLPADLCPGGQGSGLKVSLQPDLV